MLRSKAFLTVYAQIELRNTTIRIRDGYTGPGGSPTLNNTLHSAPAQPTVNEDQFTTGGSLAAGTYILAVTYTTLAGETLRSTDSASFVIESGDIPRVTFGAIPSTVSGVNIYISTPGGGTGTEKLYNASPITSGTFYDLSAAAPNVTAPPVSNTGYDNYLVGSTSLTTTGFTGALNNGDQLTFAGDTTLYQVLTHSETSSNTTSITISPALVVTIAGNAAITVQPHILSVKIGEGNLTYSEKRKIKYVTDRGLLDTVRLDDDEPMDVKLDFTWEFLRADPSATVIPTPEEAIKQVGNASHWISSAADKCEVYSVDIVLLNVPPCPGVKSELIILPLFRWEDLAHDPKTAQIAITGKCNTLTALVSRQASNYIPY